MLCALIQFGITNFESNSGLMQDGHAFEVDRLALILTQFTLI